jgi:hypothetical protein
MSRLQRRGDREGSNHRPLHFLFWVLQPKITREEAAHTCNFEQVFLVRTSNNMNAKRKDFMSATGIIAITKGFEAFNKSVGEEVEHMCLILCTFDLEDFRE